MWSESKVILILMKGGPGKLCAFIVTKMERHYNTPMLKSAQIILTDRQSNQTQRLTPTMELHGLNGLNAFES